MIDAVHQFHPVLTFGDAISNQTMSIQNLLRAAGFRAELFAEHPQPSFERKVHHFREYRRFATEDSLLLLHYSIGYSPEVLGWLEELPGRKILLYHNITPADYFIGVNPHYREAAWLGREQLQRLVQLTDGAWGDSAFNCQELQAAGWQDCRVLPIIFDPAFYRVTPDAGVTQQLAGEEGPHLLFVGRVVPNKKLEDLILTLYYLRRHVAPGATLHLVGSDDQMERYRSYLDVLVQELGVEGVRFHGRVSREQLVAFYRAADLFLCMSEHEGFCVPLVESMHFDLPIVAYAAAAVPETMGGSGILVHRKNHEAIAELVGLFLKDAGWRERVITGQRERLAHFLSERVAVDLKAYLEALP